MESDERKQKRLGPAPFASFEKSFEDATSHQLHGIPAITELNSNMTIAESAEENMDSNGESTYRNITSAQEDYENGQEQKEQMHDEHQQQSQPTISVSTPSKKRSGIGGRKPPSLQSLHTHGILQASNITDTYHHHSPKSATLHTPSTPRIELSRASSSSHHEEDSRESSPDNVFEQVGTGTLQEAIGLGFREEGALELRSSTEELYFMDPEQKREEQEKMQQVRKSPVIFKFDDHQTYLQQHQRKDSASSEVAALLCISGRTSRISSVGSQGSAISRLSAVSGISRSPSPHRMLLETSFCGPKPLENVIDGSTANAIEKPTTEALEQVLLSRKHDPTQAVFAEGITIQGSPKKTPAEQDDKRGRSVPRAAAKPTKPSSLNTIPGKSKTAKREPGKMVVGVTPSGAEYIRINLKPDHLYDDKGVAPNERVLDGKPGLGGGQKKPVSLSLGRDKISSENRLTPCSSPKPSRHAALVKEAGGGGSRSPSPGNVITSRKSSICSLFKAKESPESPRDPSRSRSKSRDRSTPQSQSGTPSKQKSVLAIFKPRRSGSKSKCSSPIDLEAMAHNERMSHGRIETPVENSSRPASRLRYYDAAPDDKGIHIPLHTPPEEKHHKELLKAVEKRLKNKEKPLPVVVPRTPITEPPSVVESNPPVKVERPAPPPPPAKPPKPQQLDKIQRIENLDAIHSLPQEEVEKERTWSLEVQRHSSQDSQETILSENSVGNSKAISSAKSNLTDVAEIPAKENGITANGANAEVQDHQSTTPNSIATADTLAKEKRRLLFATRIGSGSQEQIFSTQFSMSKTESLSSQLSEQTSISDGAAGPDLHRQDTIIRRPDDLSHQKRIKSADKTSDVVAEVHHKQDSMESQKRTSKSISDEEEKSQPVIVMMRKKDSSEESKRKSRSASEDDDGSHRHSKYLENFDVRKKLHENVARRFPNRQSSDSSIKERCSQTSSKEENTPEKVSEVLDQPDPLPTAQLPPPATVVELQSAISTDDQMESSESERDSEMDPNRVKRHLPRNVGIIEDHESTGLVSQDSFEDDLPYVPTTLPEERAHGVPLIPMKERIHMDLKTCPLDRPRSTTPLNPSCLEEYCGIVTPEEQEHVMIRGEKLRISLPRKDPAKDKTQKSKSPRRTSTSSGKSWFEFAEQGIRASSKPTCAEKSEDQQDQQLTSLPGRKTSDQWIDFDNIPEKRKMPKRITALPRENPPEAKPPTQYNYVKPEECQCECHEVERESSGNKSIASVDLLQQGEDMQPLLDAEAHEGIDPSDSSQDYSYGADDSNIVAELDSPPPPYKNGHSHEDDLEDSNLTQRNNVSAKRYS